MPTTLTLKNIPDEIYVRLKAAAESHRRSLNSEAIVCLESVLLPGRATAEEEEIGNNVSVNRNHARPSRLNASMSLAVNFPFCRESLIARALAMTSSAVARPGRSTDSRHTIASLFKLRRWLSADALSRTYTSSGIFFSVIVVGILFSISVATIMVPLRSKVKLRPNPSLKRSANGGPPGPGLRYSVHFLSPGPGVLPSSPA